VWCSAVYPITRVSKTTRKPPLAKAQTALRKQKIKYGEKRYSIWRTEFFYPALWHVAQESRHWIRQLAAPCNVAGGCGMTCHWISPNVCHIGILLLVLISTISPQSTMSHIVESSPLTKLNGGLSQLHYADEDVVSWLTMQLWLMSRIYEKKKTTVDMSFCTSLRNVIR